MDNMMSKLLAMQEQMKETKARLDTVSVQGESDGGRVKVTLTGNRRMTSVYIDPELLSNQEELEDLLIVAFNRALENADNVHESEMQNAAKGMLPNMPGM